MAKTIELLLGGEMRTLKFGGMGFFKYAGKISAGDPLMLVAGNSHKSQYETVLTVAYGGLCFAAGKELDKDEVEKWVFDMDFDDAAKMLETFTIAMTGGDGQQGEGKSPETAENASPGEN